MKHFEIFTGRIGRIEDVKELTNGNCVVNFSVAETPRIKKGDQWVDGTTIWTNVAIFGDEARNLHRSVKPGTFVTVIGDRRAQEYTAKDTNEKKVTQSIVAEQVSIAITKFHYVETLGSVNYSKGEQGTTQPTGQTANTANTANSDQDPFETSDSFNTPDMFEDSPF